MLENETIESEAVMDTEPAEQEDKHQRGGVPCLSIVLAGATMLLFASILLWPIVLHLWDSDAAKRQHYAVNHVVNFLDHHAELRTPINREEFEELLEERAEGIESSVSVFKLDADDVQLILVVPRPLLGERGSPPVAFLSQDNLKTIERVDIGKVN